MYAELKVEFDSNEINFQQSSNLQGVLMENISSEYAEKLHGNQLNPYSQCILKEEGKTIWYLKTLNTEAYEMLLLPMTKLDTITLRKKNKTVNLLNKTVRIKEDKELIKEFYENKCSRYLELSFKTPTSFKRDGKYVIYPDLSLIYQSQIRSELSTGRKNRKILNRNIGIIEKKAFCTLKHTDKEDVEFDNMSGIIVGDSEPLSREDIVLCQKWEQHVDGSYKTLNLLRECIKPGTVIKSSLTIDETECNLKIEDILDAVKLFYEQYYQVFQSKFPRCDRGKPNTVFFGGGSGFVSKTVVYPMFGEREGIEITKDIFDRTGVPQDHKHYKDTRMRVSPHILKCTRYQGKEYMM